MSKLSSFLKGLKKSQEVLMTLDEAGIDVDRLIGISNARGPQAKIIKSILTQVSGLMSIDESVGSDKPKQRSVTRASSRKRLKGESSPH